MNIEDLWTAVAADPSKDYRVTLEYVSLRTGQAASVTGDFEAAVGGPYDSGHLSLREDDGGEIHVGTAGSVRRASTNSYLGDLYDYEVTEVGQ